MGAQSSTASKHYNLVRVVDYEQLDENKIISLAQRGDEGAECFLIQKYQYLVHFKAKSYFLQGADREDTLQEGMIGLYKAIRDFRKDGCCSFRSFALLCIARQIITALKTATRKKHLPLNCYASLNSTFSNEESNSTLLDILNSTARDPSDLFIVEEELDRVKQIMKQALSKLEWDVLLAYIDGKSYQEIGEELEKNPKVVDNALCRAKLKLRELA